MDRGRAVAAHLDRRHGVRLAVRHRDRLAAGAQGLLGQDRCSTASSTCRWCCRRSSPAICCSFRSGDGADRRLPGRDHFGIVFSFRWTGAALACGVMGFPLMVRPIRLALEAIDRRLEDAAATLGANRLLGIPHHHPAAGVARHHRRRGDVLCPGARRIRRHHNVRVQYSRRDADHLGGDLHLAASPRRRSCGGAAGADRDRDSRSPRSLLRNGSPAAPACAFKGNELARRRRGERSSARSSLGAVRSGAAASRRCSVRRAREKQPSST